MISYLHGELVAVDQTAAVIDVGGVGYEVLVPLPVADRLEARGIGAHVKIFTYHCERGGAAGGGVPMLVGFETELERAFFELLLGVPQLGPVGASKALALPIPTIARAICFKKAEPQISITSRPWPSRNTSTRRSSRTGLLASQDADRKLEKSWVPIKPAAAFLMAATSSS